MEDIDDTHNGIIAWRKDLLKFPSEKTPKLFIRELTKWLEHYNNSTDITSTRSN